MKLTAIQGIIRIARDYLHKQGRSPSTPGVGFDPLDFSPDWKIQSLNAEYSNNGIDLVITIKARKR